MRQEKGAPWSVFTVPEVEILLLPYETVVPLGSLFLLMNEVRQFLLGRERDSVDAL